MELAKLSTRILCDNIPESVLLYSKTIIYCFAHNDINLPLITKSVFELKKKYNIPCYILNNKEFMSGVSKYDEVKDYYLKNNINVLPISYNNNWINTKIESDAVIDWCIDKNIKNIIICAPVFHITRAYMTIVSSLIDINRNLINIYSLPAKIDDWKNTTITHQGKNINSFNNFIEVELDRIIQYSEKKDIKKPEIIWEYIMNRN